MKHALVTGGNTGIGKAITSTLLDRGYHVLVHYYEDESAAKTLSKEPRVELIKGDLTEDRTIKHIKHIVKQHKKLDVLVNNAGINLRKNTKTARKTDWTKTYEVNVIVPFILSRALRSYVRSIINIASYRAQQPGTQDITYSASKAALVNLTKTLAQELAPIRVNSISPGKTRTRMQKHYSTSTNLLTRIAEPDEIAHMVVHVAENTYMTGTDVCVDGGTTIKYGKRNTPAKR